MNTQTNLAEVSRIVGDSEVDEVRALIRRVIQGRENKHKQSVDTIAQLKARISSISSEFEESSIQYRGAECQIISIEPEVKNAIKSLQESNQKVQELELELAHQKAGHATLAEELRMARESRQRYADAFKVVFGIQAVKFEEKGEEIEIVIKPEEERDVTYTLVCGKDRSRKGLYLQVAGIDPPLPGFEDLERSYTQKSSQFTELVMKSRQLFLKQFDLCNDF